MNSQAFVGACLVLGGLGSWNTWTLYQLNQRIERVESMQTSSSQPISDTSPDGIENPSPRAVRAEATKKRAVLRQIVQSEKNVSPTPQPTEAALDLSDPNIREAIAKIAQDNAQQKETQRRQSKMEAYKNSIQHELEKFSVEKSYDTDTTKKIEAVLDESTDEWTAVREQVREGEISWLDARTEFKAIGDDTEAKVTEFISEEDYKELRSRLWGQWER